MKVSVATASTPPFTETWAAPKQLIETIDFSQVTVHYIMFESIDSNVHKLMKDARFIQTPKLSFKSSFDMLFENPKW